MSIDSLLDNTKIIFSAGFIAGACIGSIASYMFFKKQKEKELDKTIDEYNKEIDRLQHDVNKKNEEIDKAHEAMNTKNVMDIYGSNLAITKEEYSKLFSGDEYDSERIHPDRSSSDPADFEHPEEDVGDNADDASENDEEDLEDVNQFEEEIRDANRYARELRPPKFITEDAFEYEGRGVYEKRDLYYYVFDKVLATEDEEVIDDVSRVVGDALDKYGFRENDESEIYIRNFSTMTDYRITKMFAESFSGGMFE